MGEIRAFVSMTVNANSIEDLCEVTQIITRDAAQEEGVLELSYAIDESETRLLVQERYTNSDGMLAHLGAMDPTATRRLVELATVERMDVVGEPTDALREALSAFGVVTYYASLGERV